MKPNRLGLFMLQAICVPKEFVLLTPSGFLLKEHGNILKI